MRASAAAQPRCPNGQLRNRITGLCEPHTNLAARPALTKAEMDAANILLGLKGGPVIQQSSPKTKRTRSKEHTNSSSPGNKTKKAKNYKKMPIQQPRPSRATRPVKLVQLQRPARPAQPAQPAQPAAAPGGVQFHGKVWENELISSIVRPENLHAALNQPYTARHDIDKEFNILPGNRHVSIKATKRNTVDFGDALRTIENVEKSSPLEAIVIKYKQVGDIKEPTELIRINMNRPDIYLGQDFEAVREDINTINRMIKSGRPQSDYKDIVKRVQRNMRENHAELAITPKRGNPTKGRAGRLQITLPNIEGLKNRHPDLVISSDELLDYENLSRIKSAPRVFKRDANPGANP